MRVLFFTWKSPLRRFVDLVLELERGGHEVVIASPSDRPQKLPSALRGSKSIRLVAYDEVSSPEYGRAIAALRQTRDYLWYLSPKQRDAAFNRQNALRRLVRTATGGEVEIDATWPDPVLELGDDELRAADAALAGLERAIPPDRGVVDLVRRQRPNVVLVTPLVKQQMHQTEVVKASHALGVPVGFLVYSWDNLTNKGRTHVAPDKTYVWNEAQRHEATVLHGLDPETVVVTGAPHWDGFFDLQPSVGREELCRRHGFDPSRPIVLYLGSTGRISPREPEVVDRWLDMLRSTQGALRDANVLIRRHPDERQRWSDWTTTHERVSLSHHPPPRELSLYDELHHAAVVVGLNTTAQIEASILEKPVYTFLAGDELAPGQRGTLHFYSLLEGRGGVVRYAETLDEHVRQLERGLAGDYEADAIRRFCEWFVRPHGLDRPVAPILAAEVAELAQQHTRRQAGRLLLADRTRR